MRAGCQKPSQEQSKKTGLYLFPVKLQIAFWFLRNISLKMSLSITEDEVRKVILVYLKLHKARKKRKYCEKDKLGGFFCWSFFFLLSFFALCQAEYKKKINSEPKFLKSSPIKFLPISNPVNMKSYEAWVRPSAILCRRV